MDVAARVCEGYVILLKTGSEACCRPHTAAVMDSKVADAVKKHFRLADGVISLTGGAKKWECLACKKLITGSATKLKAHHILAL